VRCLEEGATPASFRSNLRMIFAVGSRGFVPGWNAPQEASIQNLPDREHSSFTGSRFSGIAVREAPHSSQSVRSITARVFLLSTKGRVFSSLRPERQDGQRFAGGVLSLTRLLYLGPIFAVLLALSTVLPGPPRAAAAEAGAAGDPDAQCAACHRSIYERYKKTPMAEGSGRAADGFLQPILWMAPRVSATGSRKKRGERG
jgi:hypothetical protein